MNKKILSQLSVVTAGAALWMLNNQNPAFAASFMGIGDIPGGDVTSFAFDVSADGSVVSGNSFSAFAEAGEAFRWTLETGIVGLGDLPGGGFNFSSGFGISGDGSVVVGISTSEASASGGGLPAEAYRWSAETGIVGLGDLPGGDFTSFAREASFDGSVVVGDGQSALGTEAFRWTAETGLLGLGDLPGGDFNSQAVSVSDDGSVVVGSGSSATGAEAFRWTAETGLVGLGDLPGGAVFSRAADVSADGLVIVGRSSSANSSGSETVGQFNDLDSEAFRWTAETGLVGLGDLPGGNFFSRALGVSGDGSVIIGQSDGFRGREPFIWDNENGMRPLIDLLTNDLGLDLSGWTNLEAFRISDDSLTIVGSGVNPEGNNEGWIAQLDPERVPEPSSAWGTLALVGAFGAGSLLKRLPKASRKLIN